MSKKDRNKTISSELSEDKMEIPKRRRTSSRPSTKKNFEIDEDMSEIKVQPKGRKSGISNYLKKSSDVEPTILSDDSKNNSDLTKYKDEYKHLIQTVKNSKRSQPCISEDKEKCSETQSKTSDSQLSLTDSTSKDSVPKTGSSVDAFQIMMDARKKVIGSNSPGKEMEVVESKVTSEEKEAKAKRFLALSMLADKKGASKRRELEELREENIKNTLDKRADAFKKMLQKGTGNKVTKKTDSEKLKEGVKDYEDIFMKKKNGKIIKKRNRDQSNICEKDAPSKKTKIQKETVQDGGTKKSITKTLIEEEDEHFLKKLSPSLKKSESMLCYFEKTNSEAVNDKTSVVIEEKEIEEEQDQIIKVKFTPKRKKRKSKLGKKVRENEKTSTSDNGKEVNEKSCQNKNTANEIETTNDDCKDKIISNQKETVNEKTVSTTSLDSQRPRRSAKRPVRYSQQSSEEFESSDSDDNMFIIKKSTKKMDNKSTNKENILTIEVDDKISPLKIINLQSPGQLKCVRSPRTVKPCEIPNDKLAPLFRKSIPKPKVDPSVMEARRLFLQSGIPEAMKKTFEKLAPTVNQDVNEFVSVCHVQQLSENDVWNLPSPKYLPDISDSMKDVITQDIVSNMSFKLNKTPDAFDIRVAEQFNTLETFDLKQGLRELKLVNQNFPIYKTFQQLWDKYINSSKSSSQDVGNSMDDLSNTTSDMNNLNKCVWTEKYKPLSSHDIIGNFQAIHAIKKWLESWKEYNEMTSTTKLVKKSRRDSSSSCDFDSSDSESRDSSRTPCNVMIITGPVGSGKTASIYAISNELNINVLEVNSTSRRTGKKFLSDMHEATQSHKVMRKQNSESTFLGLFPKNNAETKPKLLSQTKKSNSKGKLKKEDSELDVVATDSQKSNEMTMSLILIDDVDVVFEEDDGFVSAVSQLIQSSKRPILLVASDDNCSHLQRFISESNLVHFNPLSGKILGPWLDVLILIESNRIIPRLSANLLELNRGDVRRSLLQLQYWISGSKRVDDSTSCLKFVSDGFSDEESSLSWKKSDCGSVKGTDSDTISNLKKLLLSELSVDCNLDRVWWNVKNILKEISSDNCVEENHDKNDDSIKNKSTKSVELENLYKYIDTYSTIDLMQSISKSHNQNSPTSPWQMVLKDSLSESEKMTTYDNHSNTTMMWCQYMHEHSTRHFEKAFERINNDDITHIESLDIRAYERRLKIYEDFSNGISLSSQLDRGSMSMDYMATLRCMGRSEKHRSSSNLKRNNRFHNYLNCLNITCNDRVLTSACKIFNDG